MLNCVYHFNGDMQVVECDVKEILMASGNWFDHPLKAKAKREELLNMNVAVLPAKKRKKKEIHDEK